MTESSHPLDRRRGERVPINGEFAALEPGSIIFVSDLSEHGVFVHTMSRLPVGTPVELRFTVLLDDPVLIQGLARVARHHDEPRGIGVEFGPLSPEMVLRIHDVLSRSRTLDSGAPLGGSQDADFPRIPADPFETRAVSEEEFEELDLDDVETLFPENEASVSLDGADALGSSERVP